MIRNCLIACAVFSFSALPVASAAEPVSLSVPGMFGPLALNPDPYSLNAGPLGKIYISGIVSGLALWQDHHVPGDRTSRIDPSNGQIFVQKIDGPLQFYAQAGGYSLPSLGTPYLRMDQTTRDLFGTVPIAYVKFALSDNFSVMAGKLFTLIGTENTFTFQNADIERGLLWNQTNDENRGLQLNYSQGPFSGSLAFSDGFYSGRLDWLSGLATWAIDQHNSVTVIASGNIERDGRSTIATPLTQNNSQIYDLNYSYTTGPWTLSSTLQYTHVPQDAAIGLTASASTWGAGLTAKYAVDSRWNIAARTEYIDSSGGTNVMYGAGSNAWSLTLTPTYQYKLFFGRAEASFVMADHTAPGAAFGSAGNDRSQSRLLFETGISF